MKFDKKKMVKRLQRAHSHYSVNTWKKHEENHLKLMSNISQNSRKMNPFLHVTPYV